MKKKLIFVSLLVMAWVFNQVTCVEAKESESTCQVIVEENKPTVKVNNEVIIHLDSNKTDKPKEEIVKDKKVKKEKVQKEKKQKAKVETQKTEGRIEDNRTDTVKEATSAKEVKNEEIKVNQVKKEENKSSEIEEETPKQEVKNEELKINEVKKEDSKKEEVKADSATLENTTVQDVKPTKSEKDKNLLNSEVMTFISRWEDLQNAHKLSSIKKLYADEYINTDGYNKEQMFKLMSATFDNYPDIKTEYSVDAVTINSNYAALYISQNVTATTKLPSKITGDNGQYNANLRTIIYIKKINKEWKIYSEQTTYEVSALAYGTAKNLRAELKVPQKVFSGSDYCAGVSVDIPADYTAIASINSTQLVEGFKLNGENFRQVSLADASLERVLKANSDNNNEAVFVSIGYTQQNHDMFKKPKIELSGLLMLMQRVDVIPVTSNFNVQKGQDATKK